MTSEATNQLLSELRENWSEEFKSAYAQVEARIEDLDVQFQKLCEDRDLRSSGNGHRVAKAGELLAPEQKMVDVVRRKGDFQAGNVRLGACVSALVNGRAIKGLLRPDEEKVLSESVDPSGGWLVPEELSGMLIDLARNKARVIQAGAMTMPMGTDVTHLAKLEAGVSGSWRPENDPVSVEDPQFGRLTLTAKTAAVLVKLSVELFEDLSAEAFGLIEHDIIEALALKLDYAALRGQADAGESNAINEPAGIAATTGINVVDLGTDGATPTNYDFLIDAIGDVWDHNGEPNAVIYSARTARTLAKLKAGVSVTDERQLQPPAEVQALSRLVSNQVPNDLTHGANSDCSAAYVGDWSKLIIGVRPAVAAKVIPLREAFASNMQVGLLAYIRADVAVGHPEHFTEVQGIRAV